MESLFGLTVVPIDMPTLTSYDREIDDSHRLEKTRAVSDFNERVIVNAIKFRSFWDPGKSRPTGAEVNVYHDSSISAYGQQRAVEASPAIAIGGTPGNRHAAQHGSVPGPPESADDGLPLVRGLRRRELHLVPPESPLGLGVSSLGPTPRRR